ncbi:hypothetical protein ACFQW4_02065 [Pantoea sp. GCM10028869]|uniref:hypothetical protein n=1 Tax=Pantoea sp. GCM10028869 TaxID=3273417 RepID=UPI00360BB0C8
MNMDTRGKFDQTPILMAVNHRVRLRFCRLNRRFAVLRFLLQDAHAIIGKIFDQPCMQHVQTIIAAPPWKSYVNHSCEQDHAQVSYLGGNFHGVTDAALNAMGSSRRRWRFRASPKPWRGMKERTAMPGIAGCANYCSPRSAAMMLSKDKSA